jgi:hypothetical protein
MLSVSITGNSFNNVGKTAGTQGIVCASMQVFGSGATGGWLPVSPPPAAAWVTRPACKALRQRDRQRSGSAGGAAADWNGNAGGAGPCKAGPARPERLL